jgi:hypothetical protein
MHVFGLNDLHLTVGTSRPIDHAFVHLTMDPERLMTLARTF